MDGAAVDAEWWRRNFGSCCWWRPRHQHKDHGEALITLPLRDTEVQVPPPRAPSFSLTPGNPSGADNRLPSNIARMPLAAYNPAVVSVARRLDSGRQRKPEYQWPNTAMSASRWIRQGRYIAQCYSLHFEISSRQSGWSYVCRPRYFWTEIVASNSSLLYQLDGTLGMGFAWDQDVGGGLAPDMDIPTISHGTSRVTMLVGVHVRRQRNRPVGGQFW